MSQEFTSTLPTTGTDILNDNIASRQNENSLRSNFSGTSFPISPVLGQKCYREDLLKEYQYNGTSWVEAGSNSTVSNEVILSRGQLTSLDDRLAVSLNEDGTLKTNVMANISEWIISPLAITYVSTSSFSVVDNQTGVFTTNRLVRCELSASYVYASIASASFADGITVVTLSSPVLDATVKQISYGVLQKQNEQYEKLMNLWQSGYSYALGDRIYTKTHGSNKYMECTTSGISGTSEPIWGAVGESLTDNSIVWKIRDNSGLLNGVETARMADIITKGPWVDVRAFGAKGDGISDDSQAIKDAIAAVPTTGGTLFFPTGTYLHGDGVTTATEYPLSGCVPTGPDIVGRDIRLRFDGYKNIRVTGYGAKILSHSGNAEVRSNAVFEFENCENVLLEGVTVDGNIEARIPVLNDYSNGSGFNYGKRNNVDFYNCKNCRIVDVVSQNSMMDGFIIDGHSENITLENCKALYSYRQGLSVGLSKNTKVYGGHFSFSGTKYGTLPKSGIDLEGGGTGTIENAVFDGITIEGNAGSGLVFSLNCVGATVQNSYIINDGISGEQSATSYNNTIINCTFTNSDVYILQAGILIDKCKFYYDKDFVMSNDCIYVNDDSKTSTLGARESTITNSVLRCNLDGRVTKNIGRVRIYGTKSNFSNNTLFNVSNVDNISVPAVWVLGAKGFVENNQFITDNASFCDGSSFVFTGTVLKNIFIGYTANTNYSTISPRFVDGIQQYDYVCKTFRLASGSIGDYYKLSGLTYGIVKITWVEGDGNSYTEELVSSSPYTGSASAKRKIIEVGTPNALLVSTNISDGGAKRKLYFKINKIDVAFGIKVEMWVPNTANQTLLGQDIVLSAKNPGDDISAVSFKSAIVSGGRYTTAARPTTTYYLLIKGDMVYDTTLNKPIWWNGTAWTDAAGTTL